MISQHIQCSIERLQQENAQLRAFFDAERVKVKELEAAIVGWKEDQRENMMLAAEEHQRANKAEQELAAAQATIARQREVLRNVLDTRNAEAKAAAAFNHAAENYSDDSAEDAAYGKAAVAASEAEREARNILSSPTNLDQLHEDRANTLEDCARYIVDLYDASGTRNILDFAGAIRKEAAAHRARKEGK